MVEEHDDWDAGRFDEGADEAVDLALAAWREDDGWHVQELVPSAGRSVQALVAAVRRFGTGTDARAGALGAVVVDEDFFVLVRVTASGVRVLLSDATAADEYDLAADVLDHLRLPAPADDDLPVPAGDLTVLADLGMHPVDLEVLLAEDELYPDEMLSDIARAVGFAEAYDEVAGLTGV